MAYAAIGLLGIAGMARGGDALPSVDPAIVKAGRAVYREYCASCHGTKGEGAANWQKPDAQGELPAPPHGPQGHTWKHSDAMLYRIVQRGWRDPFNKTERLTMPGFAQQLSPKQTMAVITYLKTLWTREQRRFQWEESKREPFPPEAR
jgi:mono/diheme cytochrome c family protein